VQLVVQPSPLSWALAPRVRVCNWSCSQSSTTRAPNHTGAPNRSSTRREFASAPGGMMTSIATEMCCSTRCRECVAPRSNSWCACTAWAAWAAWADGADARVPCGPMEATMGPMRVYRVGRWGRRWGRRGRPPAAPPPLALPTGRARQCRAHGRAWRLGAATPGPGVAYAAHGPPGCTRASWVPRCRTDSAREWGPPRRPRVTRRCVATEVCPRGALADAAPGYSFAAPRLAICTLALTRLAKSSG